MSESIQTDTSTEQTGTHPKPCVSEEDKIAQIAHHFREIIRALGLDDQAEGLRKTPKRVAKMYVKELFSGLEPSNKPHYTLFANTQNYHGILLQQRITFFSCCEHHFVPIQGIAHVAYIPKAHIIGLSKINRLVQYFAKRPQVQERLTEQIAQEMSDVLQTPDIAVIIDAKHFCVCARGVSDDNSRTQTLHFRGAFEQSATQSQLYHLLNTAQT